MVSVCSYEPTPFLADYSTKELSRVNLLSVTVLHSKAGEIAAVHGYNGSTLEFGACRKSRPLFRITLLGAYDARPDSYRHPIANSAASTERSSDLLHGRLL